MYSNNLKSILENISNPTNTLFYFFDIGNILRNINADVEDTRKIEGKLELLTGSESQIALYLVKYTSY